MTTASPAVVPMFMSHEEEDDDFGEFEFAASASASLSPNLPPNYGISNQAQRGPVAGEGDDDDEWSGFLENTLQPELFWNPRQPAPPTTLSSHSFFSFDPLPGLQAPTPDLTPISSETTVGVEKEWQKPSGALPLSLFGGDEEEDAGEGSSSTFDPPFPAISGGLFGSSVSPVTNGLASAPSGDLKDLIAGLYGRQDNISPAASGNASFGGDKLQIDGDNGHNSNSTDGGGDGEDGFDECCWSLKMRFPVLRKEGNLADIPRVEEAKPADIGSIFQTSGTLILKASGQEREDMLGTNLLPIVLSDEQQWEGALVSNDTKTNGFDFGPSGNGYGFTSIFCQGDEHANIENGLNPNSNGQNENLEDLYVSAWKTESVDNGTKALKDASVISLNDLISNVNIDAWNIPSAYSGQITGGENLAISAVAHEALNSTGDKNSGQQNSKIKDKDFASKNTYGNISLEPMILLDFYSRLKQKSCTLALRHIDNLKLRKNNERGVPDEEPKLVVSDDEIEAAFITLGISDSNRDHVDSSPQDELSVNELLEFMKDSGLQAFNIEYCLSEKVPPAEKDLSSAMWLFEHASSILSILTLSSFKEQHSYISSWSKMASACELELQRGAMIWAQAVSANVQTELLLNFQAQQYFLALGEIYRVVEILSASARLYKPWILVNLADSKDILRNIDTSAVVWRDSGLKQALEVISSNSIELKVASEELLESINSISNLGAQALHGHISGDGVQICRLSLLPLEFLPGL
ncbi:unnamed protein product [Spirodela intermedia]|uniref:Synergin gamma C-terminal domain-containing protein n=1 Tax=Spirodela intermedia TaxID=51605 RepID=A0A7I8I960_SPIIN|nr:unnamed protein product [Spirodela intermedia]CAA6654150.1 unnamed protein product [Spirodela intermedia]